MKLGLSRRVVAVVVTEAAEDVDVRAAAEAVAAAAVVVVAAGAVSAGSIVFFHRYFCQPAPAERELRHGVGGAVLVDRGNRVAKVRSNYGGTGTSEFQKEAKRTAA